MFLPAPLDKKSVGMDDSPITRRHSRKGANCLNRAPDTSRDVSKHSPIGNNRAWGNLSCPQNWRSTTGAGTLARLAGNPTPFRGGKLNGAINSFPNRGGWSGSNEDKEGIRPAQESCWKPFKNNRFNTAG